jgi:hypothetical protein
MSMPPGDALAASALPGDSLGVSALDIEGVTAERVWTCLFESLNLKGTFLFLVPLVPPLAGARGER